MPDFLYDLFVGHEVVHALVTPAEGGMMCIVEKVPHSRDI